ncbi:WD40/YVTN/BNR-like repeat-containing protein [Streptomyces sp. NBC_00258]|uniref:WD40/YVTN/BNR-like repeat-containing protein n=1 Tax=Streptomyces sp. NBC_00258 TaxID=2903642 RepID=UPI002E27F379|nr:oxidoreductase [Streptomyces sp. NBC_00258]
MSAASTGPVTPVASGLTPSWRFTPTATNDTLIVVDVVDRDVVWAAGGGFQGATGDGSVVRSVDGGRSWRNVTPPGGAVDEFRDVEAFDRDHALVLTLSSATEPPRIYRTADGGASWQLVFRDPDPEAFYSCMAFFDDRRGLAVGDPAGGRFPIQTTADGGRTWHPAPTGSLPVAQPGDGALATGTCMAAQGPRDAWFATTGTRSEPTRSPQVFHTRDGGRTWSVADTPIPGATSAIASLSFLDRRRGLAVGGNFAPPQGVDVGAAARTVDGGAAWFAGRAPAGFRNSVAWVPSRADTAVAVGPGGSDVSTNGGRTWEQFDHTLLLGVNCAPHAGCWAVGENGLAARLVLTHH